MIWDKYFLELAYTASLRSKDKHFKTGAVIVSPPPERHLLSTGMNGPVRGTDDSKEERYERPEKYFWMEHAERNAVYAAARHGGAPLRGSTIYCPVRPCMDCARAICQAGIVEVVIHKEAQQYSKNWEKDKARVVQLFKEAGVTLKEISYRRD